MEQSQEEKEKETDLKRKRPEESNTCETPKKRRRRQRKHASSKKKEKKAALNEKANEINVSQQTQKNEENPTKKKRKRRHKKKVKPESEGTEQAKKIDWKGFSQGNYNTYYNYRLANQGGDSTRPFKRHGDRRFNFFKKEWFYGKNILDMGCNAGFVTIGIAEKFLPKSILGVDVDSNLVEKANNSLKALIAKRYSSLTGDQREIVNANWKQMIEKSGESIPQTESKSEVQKSENVIEKNDKKNEGKDQKEKKDETGEQATTEAENVSPLLSIFLSNDQRHQIPPPIGPEPVFIFIYTLFYFILFYFIY